MERIGDMMIELMCKGWTDIVFTLTELPRSGAVYSVTAYKGLNARTWHDASLTKALEELNKVCD